jgi:hypothetical protein
VLNTVARFILGMNGGPPSSEINDKPGFHFRLFIARFLL